MSGTLMGWEDTIVALATPPGVGAIGVIRISGKESFPIMDRIFPSKKISVEKTHTLHVGFLKIKETIIDEVVVSVFRGPRSYTGEDVIEISGHGSPYVLQQIIDTVIMQGARLARAGEFTQRAFLNGKLDLTQAEAVADLIASNTAASHKTALTNMRGGFSEQLMALRERLVRFSALIELELDFSQEDVEFADRGQFYALINEITTTVDNLIESFKLGNVIRNGISVAIVGKPNAGKSTLLNTLLNEDRAIVSEIPGTTRDTIEEVLNIDGILFRLIDTAGIRQHTADVIESFGVERSLQKMKEAGLVIYLFDANITSAEELVPIDRDLVQQQVKHLLVANKTDQDETLARKKFSALSHTIYISAKEKNHIAALKERIVDTVLEGTVQSESAIVTNARHFHALRKLRTSLTDIRLGLDNRLPGDLLAVDIKDALQYLSEITGEVTSEEQLGYIFSKFCIGK
jgi:tRNA modification GTPase